MLCLALLVFCAVISGWTAALAQIQAQAAHGPIVSGHAQHHGSASAQAGAGDDHDCREKHGDCRHSSKSVHPQSCAACFAIETSGFGVAPLQTVRSSPEASPQATLIATDHKPRLPPPRRFFPS